MNNRLLFLGLIPTSLFLFSPPASALLSSSPPLGVVPSSSSLTRNKRSSGSTSSCGRPLSFLLPPLSSVSRSRIVRQLQGRGGYNDSNNNANGGSDTATKQRQRDLEEGDLISDFCRGTNEFWKRLVIAPVRDYVEIRPAGTFGDGNNVLSKLTAPPEVPGIPRPVWFTILGSVPTGLMWYGYYKFCVEEELYQYELQTDGRATGCGGYGTLFPFVYGVIVGFPLSLLHVPVGDFVLEAAGLWILLGQVNLYRRVNELCTTKSSEQLDVTLQGEPPLYAWWALLPPPLDVVVGLRQVHFLSEYWRVVRNEPYDKDIVAEEWFPFISSRRFTLKQFFRTPSLWFWFTKDWKDFDQFDFLKD